MMEGGHSEVGCMVHGGDMEQGRSVWEGGRAEGAACAKALGGGGSWTSSGSRRGQRQRGQHAVEGQTQEEVQLWA